MSESGCAGCFQSAKGLAQAYSVKRAEAVRWSQDNQRSVALYYEGFEIMYMDAEAAVNNGLTIREIIIFS